MIWAWVWDAFFQPCYYPAEDPPIDAAGAGRSGGQDPAQVHASGPPILRVLALGLIWGALLCVDSGSVTYSEDFLSKAMVIDLTGQEVLWMATFWA